MTVMRILPSSSSSVWPGSTASKICGCGRNTRSAPPSLSVVSKRKVAPSVERDALAGDVADAELRALQVGTGCRSAARSWPPPCARRACTFFTRSKRRVAHVDAEHVDARLEQALDHLRGVRRRSERGDDLDAPRASHLALAPPSLGSVRRMVQSLDFLGVHLEEAGALIAASGAVLNPPDRERSCRSVHMTDLPAHSPPRS